MDIEITDTATGEVRIFHDVHLTKDEADWPPYLWTEGNFACDCNRALCFARAIGEPDPETRPCGDTRYVIRFMTEDGPQA